MSGRNPGTDDVGGLLRQSPGGAVADFSTADVLGVRVARITTAEFMRWLLSGLITGADRAADGPGATPLFVTYLNAACSNIAADDPEYAGILGRADCVYADGQAVVWAAGYLSGGLPERVNAGDFIVEFCREAAAREVRIGLVGGRPGVAAAAAASWLREVPTLDVAGTWHGFFAGERQIVEAIREQRIDVLLVGMGVPLQEKWAWGLRDELGVQAVWCVGALFEYYGEGRARAPVWMRRAGMEWLFRLMLEPGRLWRRYLVGNVRFVRRVMGYKRG